MMDNSAVEKVVNIIAEQYINIVTDGYVEPAQAILAAIGADPLAYVKPKPLEWGDNKASTGLGSSYRLAYYGKRNAWTLYFEPGEGNRIIGEDHDYMNLSPLAYDDLCNRVKELY